MVDLNNYKIITISGKIASGTTTLAKNLARILKWEYFNAGDIQRQYDRLHHIHENKQGAASRPDEHERQIDAFTKKMLTEKTNLIYEAWLAGFMAQGIDKILKVLVICSNEALRIDRVVNRENISVEEAKIWIKNREEENISKWKKLYGNYDFWDPKYYDLIIDTYSSGRMETVGKVLDKINYHSQ
jgi:predicted cytidylate kinase